jgi:hypothetical protein
MKTVADFRRAAVVGSVWRCTNHNHPQMSGLRTVTKGKTVLSYDYTKADGSGGSNGRLEFPKADACRIEGDSVHFLHEPGSDRVAFTWTFVRNSEAA